MPWDDPVLEQSASEGGGFVEPALKPAKKEKYSQADLTDIASTYAKKYGADIPNFEPVFLALGKQESGFKHDAKSPTGVKGLYQVTLGTGRMYKPDLTDDERNDPHVSAELGAKHLRALYQEHGNWPDAVFAYNGGSDPQFRENVGRHLPWARNLITRRATAQTDAGHWDEPATQPPGYEAGAAMAGAILPGAAATTGEPPRSSNLPTPKGQRVDPRVTGVVPNPLTGGKQGPMVQDLTPPAPSLTGIAPGAGLPALGAHKINLNPVENRTRPATLSDLLTGQKLEKGADGNAYVVETPKSKTPEQLKIDQEVSDIMAGPHGELPPMTKVGGSRSSQITQKDLDQKAIQEEEARLIGSAKSGMVNYEAKLPELPVTSTFETGRKPMPERKLAAEGWKPAQLEDGSWTLVKGDKRTKDVFGSAEEAQNYGLPTGETVYSATIKAPTGAALIKGLKHIPGRLQLPEEPNLSEGGVGDILRQQMGNTVKMPSGPEGPINPAEVAAALKETGGKLTPATPVMPESTSSNWFQQWQEKGAPLSELKEVPSIQDIANRANYGPGQFPRGLVEGISLGKISIKPSPPGTEKFREAGQFTGASITLATAIALANPAVAAAVPAMAGTWQARMVASGLGAGWTGATAKAIEQANKGQSASFAGLMAMGNAASQDAANMMVLHLGTETAAASIPFLKMFKDYWKTGKTEVAERQKAMVREDLQKAWYETHPEVVDPGTGKPIVPSDATLTSFWENLPQEQRVSLFKNSKTMEELKFAAKFHGVPLREAVMDEAVTQAGQTTGPAPQPEPVPANRQLGAPAGGMATPPPQPQQPPGLPAPDLLKTSPEDVGIPSLQVRTAIEGLAADSHEGNRIKHDLALGYRSLHPDSVNLHPEEIWGKLTAQDMMGLYQIPRAKAALEKLLTGFVEKGNAAAQAQAQAEAIQMQPQPGQVQPPEVDLKRPASGRLFSDEQIKGMTHEELQALPPEQQKIFRQEAKAFQAEQEKATEAKTLPAKGKIVPKAKKPIPEAPKPLPPEAKAIPGEGKGAIPEKIESPIVYVNGKIFKGKNHGLAMDKAIEAGEVIEKKDGYFTKEGEDLYGSGWNDLFITNKGKIIDRFKADELFDVTSSERLEKNRVFQLGKDVSFNLPQGSSTIRPSKDAIAAAANKLGISKTDARAALDYYLYADQTQKPPKIKPTPTQPEAEKVAGRGGGAEGEIGLRAEPKGNGDWHVFLGDRFIETVAADSSEDAIGQITMDHPFGRKVIADGLKEGKVYAPEVMAQVPSLNTFKVKDYTPWQKRNMDSHNAREDRLADLYKAQEEGYGFAQIGSRKMPITAAIKQVEGQSSIPEHRAAREKAQPAPAPAKGKEALPETFPGAMKKITGEARGVQEQFLKEKGLSWDQVRSWPIKEQQKLQSEYSNWRTAEPWEMTADEHRIEGGKLYEELGNENFIHSDFRLYSEGASHKIHQEAQELFPNNSARQAHYAAVKRAIEEGKPVPPEVLADYPDLAKPDLKPAEKGAGEEEKYKEKPDGKIAQGSASPGRETADRGTLQLEDGETARRDFQTFKAGIMETGSEGKKAIWKIVEHSESLTNSPIGQAIVAKAKAQGMANVFFVKNAPFEAALTPTKDGFIMTIDETPNRINRSTLEQVVGHETFHYYMGIGNSAAINLCSKVNQESPAFKILMDDLNKWYGDTPLTAIDVAIEVAADYAGGVEIKTLTTGEPIALSGLFKTKATAVIARRGYLREIGRAGSGLENQSKTLTKRGPPGGDKYAERTTGIKNAVTEEERETKGQSPVEVETRRTFGEAFDRGKRLVDSGQLNPRTLAASLAEKPRALNAEESVALIYDRMRLQNDHARVMEHIEKAVAAGDNLGTLESRQRLAKIEDDINTNDEAARRTGYEQGLGLAARKIMIAEDYSLARTLQRLRVATGLKELPEELRDKIAALTKQLQEAMAKSEAYEEKIKTLEAEAKLKKVVREVPPAQRKAAQRGERKQALKAEFKSLAEKLNAKLYHLNMTFDPEAIGILGEMAKNLVETGIIDAKEIISNIYQELQDLTPNADMSERDIRDAISGYGKIFKLSQEEIATELREARRQMRLISALEDAEAKQVPLRSGLQRDPISDEVRTLQKQVKQAMRESGIDSTTTRTPEEQWKTSLDAVKTRLHNQIFDITKRLAQLRAGETPEIKAKKLGIKYDKEAEDLKAERDALQKSLQEIEGKPQLSPEQRIRIATGAVEKSIAEYERRIKEHDLAPGKKLSLTPETPELKALRARRDKLTEQFKQMQKDAKPAVDPMATALKSYKTRTTNRIAELENMLATGNFEKKARRVLKMDPEAQRLKANVERAKDAVDKAVFLQKLAARSKFVKGLDWAVKWRRAVILSGSATILKLNAAAMMRQVSTPMEEVVGSFLRMMPYLKPIFALAPRQGAGFNVRAEAVAFTVWFKKETFREIKAAATTGVIDLDLLYGKKKPHAPATMLDFFGHMHKALKVIPELNEFYRSLQHFTEFAMARGFDMSEPANVMAIGTAAYAESLRAIFMNDNMVTTAYRNLLNYVKSQGPAGKSLAALLQIAMPIVKVPTNFANEIASYTLGVVPATVRLFSAGGTKQIATDMQKAIDNKNLPALLAAGQNADYVARNIKKNGLGFLLALIGMASSLSIGGYFQRGEKRKGSDVKPGDIKLLGVTIPHLLLHHPAIMGPLDIGATIVRVTQHIEEYNRKHPPDMNKGSGISEGIEESFWGIAKGIPFVDEPFRIAKAAETPGGYSKFLNEIAESLVTPPDVRRIAMAMDKAGEQQVPRERKTLGQTLQGSIPGQRSKLPLDIGKMEHMPLDRLAEIVEKAPAGTIKGNDARVVAKTFYNKIKAEWGQMKPAEREKPETKELLEKYKTLVRGLTESAKSEPPKPTDKQRTKQWQRNPESFLDKTRARGTQ